MPLFSQRNAPIQDRYHYDISEAVRSRILHTLKHCIRQHSHQMFGFDQVARLVEQSLYRNVGSLRRPVDYAVPRNVPDVVVHFFSCEDEEVLDFLELCFATQWNCGGNPTVDAINEVFEEEGIGYGFTRFREVQGYGAYDPGVAKAYRKGEDRLHAEVVLPCLRVLADPRFTTANSELLDAFAKIRKGAYSDAITSCGSAFESVLKSICAAKRWAYDADGDTCATLLDACKTNGLFPGFYKPIFEAVGTIRNKLGDAHGRAQTPHAPASPEQAEHGINLVCTHIVLLVGLSGL
jgi:hypothetical protein